MAEKLPSQELPHNFKFGDVVNVRMSGGEVRSVVLADLGVFQYDHEILTSKISDDDKGERLGFAGSQSYKNISPTDEQPWDIDRIINAQLRHFEGYVSDMGEQETREKLRQEFEGYRNTFNHD